MWSPGAKRRPLSCNMMPFVMGDMATLPADFHPYWKTIAHCLDKVPDEIGKVGYLTIHEGWVEKGKTQRRAGVHVELAKGVGKIANFTKEHFDESANFGRGATWTTTVKTLSGGVFMASDLADSTRV